MNDERTVDRPSALVAMVVANSMGGNKTSLDDFMPYRKKVDEEPSVTNPEELASIFGGLKR